MEKELKDLEDHLAVAAEELSLAVLATASSREEAVYGLTMCMQDMVIYINKIWDEVEKKAA